MPDTKRTRLAVTWSQTQIFWGTFLFLCGMGCFAGLTAYGQAAPSALAPSYQGVLLDFSATWCGPCQQMSPIVDRLEREHLPVRKVDVDQQAALARQFNISSIPCFVLVINGREVQRLQGAQSESTIRQLVARIPQSAPPQQQLQLAQNNAGNDRRTSPPQFPGKVSAPTPPALAAQQARNNASNTAANNSSSGFSFFGKNTRAADPVEQPAVATEARAKVDELKLPKFIKPTPMNASVRISVTHRASGADLGSGTIISSAVGQTYVLTCGHLFRNFKSDSVIEVDFFVDRKEKPVTFVGKLIRHNLLADVGLISIPTDTPLPAVHVAGSDYALQSAQEVTSIGCAGGEIPTKQFLKITNINRYKGPHNIECTGVPEQGRSGGGLFGENGSVIGVCSAADKRDQRGIYAGLKAIHSLLEECKLSQLYRNGDAPEEKSEVPESEVEVVDSTEIRKNSVAKTAEAGMDARHDRALRKLAESLGDLGDQEVVFLMPGDTSSQEPRKLMILRDAQMASETRDRR